MVYLGYVINRNILPMVLDEDKLSSDYSVENCKKTTKCASNIKYFTFNISNTQKVQYIESVSHKNLSFNVWLLKLCTRSNLTPPSDCLNKLMCGFCKL